MRKDIRTWWVMGVLAAGGLLFAGCTDTPSEALMEREQLGTGGSGPVAKAKKQSSTLASDAGVGDAGTSSAGAQTPTTTGHGVTDTVHETSKPDSATPSGGVPAPAK